MRRREPKRMRPSPIAWKRPGKEPPISRRLLCGTASISLALGWVARPSAFAEADPSAALRVIAPHTCVPAMEDYTFMGWAYGWRGRSPEGARVLAFQTGRFGSNRTLRPGAGRRSGEAPLPWADRAAEVVGCGRQPSWPSRSDAAKGTIQHTYPIALVATGDEQVEFSVTGGLGYVPITISGRKRPHGWQLLQSTTGVWKPVARSAFPQADYDPSTPTWRLTWNVSLDRLGDSAGAATWFKIAKTTIPEGCMRWSIDGGGCVRGRSEAPGRS